MGTSGDQFSRWYFTRWQFSRWVRRFTVLVLLGALAMPLASCGKKAQLDPPPGGEDSPFPRSYPTQ